MRASKLALAAVVIFAARAAPAQTVIDVEGQKPAEQPVQQEVQPQSNTEPQPKIGDAAPAQTKEAPADAGPDGGRYRFNRVDNGFLRLDNLNGQIAYCRPQTIGWLAPLTRSGLKLSPVAEKHWRSNSGSLSARAQKPWLAKAV